MADKIPIRGGFSGASLTGLAQFASGDTLGVAHGGTGIVTIGSNALVTGNGTSAMTSESNLTFDGTILKSTGDICATVKVVAPALCIGSEYVLPTADGSAGQLMCTDGSGALAFATVASTSPGGSDTYVQFNNSSAFGGSANLTWDDTTLATTAFTATGNVSLNGGTFVFNESGADKDFRIEGDTDANLFVADASTDRIGIGTATPATPLHVYGAGNVVKIDGSSGTEASMAFTPASGNGWQLGAGPLTANSFQLYENTAAAARITVLEGGKVGIGTVAPDTTLHVHTGSAGTISTTTGMGLTVEDSDSGGIQIITPDSDAANIFFGSASDINNARITSEYNSGVAFLAFQTEAAEAMRIDGTGKVGIGTTAPGALLAVKGNVAVGSSSSNATLLGNQTAGGLDVMVGSGTNAFQVWSDNDTSVPRFLVQRAGNVGIGMTAPVALLDIRHAGTGEGESIILGNTGEGTYGFLGYNKDSPHDAFIGGTSVTIKTGSSRLGGSTTKMMVTSAGDIGIGCDTPTQKLTVAGCVYAAGGYLVGWNTTNPKRVCDGGDRCLFFTNDMCYNCALWGHNMKWSIAHCGSERWNMYTSGSSCCYRHMGITISNGGGLTTGWYQGNDPICSSCRYWTSPCRVCAGTDLIAPSKSFIINHPCCDADTPNRFNSMLLKHVTSEAPEYNVFYRGSATLCNGIAIVELPEYFESLTHDDDRTVQLTAVGGWSPLTVKTHVEDGQFEVCTTAEGDLAQEFDWRVDARRFDGYIREEALDQGVVNEDGDMIDEYWKPEFLINDTPEEPDNLDALDEDDIKEMLNYQDIDVDDTDTKEELLVKLREPWETRMKRGAVRAADEDPPAHRVANLSNVDKSKPNPGKKKNRRQK